MLPHDQSPKITSFKEHIDSLPPWKQDLLEGIFRANAVDRLSQHLLQGTPLLLCSDGGAKKHSGSFGWVIATANTCPWECSGSATGWFANSFRSKGIGQLALLVFLETFFECYQLHDIPVPLPTPSDPWIRIATDNKGLIDRITSGLAAKVAFAGAALNSECDVVNEIVETAR
jgi:hypothetical protein